MSEIIYRQDAEKKRKFNEEELAQIEKDRAEYEAEQKRIEAETTAKAEAKASAMAKLAALGLSDEEIQAIIGA